MVQQQHPQFKVLPVVAATNGVFVSVRACACHPTLLDFISTRALHRHPNSNERYNKQRTSDGLINITRFPYGTCPRGAAQEQIEKHTACDWYHKHMLSYYDVMKYMCCISSTCGSMHLS